jgi:acylphosphatase
MDKQQNLTVNAAVKITVSGRVQGVGFRYYIAINARELQINGYAKNLYNGDVEIYGEGRKEFLEEFVKRAKLGPSHAIVDTAHVQWLDFKNKYDNFDIR